MHVTETEKFQVVALPAVCHRKRRCTADSNCVPLQAVRQYRDVVLVHYREVAIQVI
jgi:hypothetical protein